jgi:hypothetical protein
MTEICVRVGVTEDMAIMTAIDTITLVEGYDAMRICLETIWRRYGKDAEQIEFVLAGLKWADGSPVDPTMWEDWLAAVQITCSGRTPGDHNTSNRYSARNPS